MREHMELGKLLKKCYNVQEIVVYRGHTMWRGKVEDLRKLIDKWNGKIDALFAAGSVLNVYVRKDDAA